MLSVMPRDADVLTPREMRFVIEYVDDPRSNGTQAAIRAQYSPKGAAVQAHRLLSRANVQQAIQRKIEERDRVSELTVEKIAQQIQADHDKAVELAQLGPAVKASELLGKWRRMFIERIEHEGQAVPAQVAVIIADSGARAQIAELERRLAALPPGDSPPLDSGDTVTDSSDSGEEAAEDAIESQEGGKV